MGEQHATTDASALVPTVVLGATPGSCTPAPACVPEITLSKNRARPSGYRHSTSLLRRPASARMQRPLLHAMRLEAQTRCKQQRQQQLRGR